MKNRCLKSISLNRNTLWKAAVANRANNTNQISVKIDLLRAEIVNRSSAPVDQVLVFFLNKADAFQNIGDVIDSPLLNVQGLGSL